MKQQCYKSLNNLHDVLEGTDYCDELLGCGYTTDATRKILAKINQLTVELEDVLPGLQASIDEENNNPIINSTMVLRRLYTLSANDWGMSEKEYKKFLTHEGKRVVVVCEACDNYYDVIIIDDNIRIPAISKVHLEKHYYHHSKN